MSNDVIIVNNPITGKQVNITGLLSIINELWDGDTAEAIKQINNTIQMVTLHTNSDERATDNFCNSLHLLFSIRTAFENM